MVAMTCSLHILLIFCLHAVAHCISAYEVPENDMNSDKPLSRPLSLVHKPEVPFLQHQYPDELSSPHLAAQINPLVFSDGVSCGKREIGKESRIVGGSEAQPHEFPWLVSLQVKLKGVFVHNCGGAVISAAWVLTAGHCTTFKEEELGVLAGINNVKHPEGHHQFRLVKKIFVKDYDDDSYKNDIALIKLENPFKLDKIYIVPLCLPKPHEKLPKISVEAGWGRLKYEGKLPDVMEKVVLPFMNTSECFKFLKKVEYDYYLHDGQICTYRDHEDSCQGDSGGPSMCKREDGTWYACAVVSWGSECARPGYPSVCTDVTYFLSWIEETMEKNK